MILNIRDRGIFYMLLRCTQKFLTELRLKKTDITPYPKAEHPLDEWYAHVFTLYPRRKCTVFVHAGTMFCFFVLDVKRADLHAISGIFRQGLGEALFDEHYPEPVIKLFNERMKEIRVTSTLDRVVIGTINRMILDLQYFGNEADCLKIRNKSVLGAYFRRGSYLAFPEGPLKTMRNILLDLDELKGEMIPEPISDKAISVHLGVNSIYS